MSAFDFQKAGVSASVSAPRPLRRLTLLLAVILPLLLASCGINQPAPVKQTYLLQVAPPSNRANAAPKPVSLKVSSVSVGAPFRGRSIVFREAEFRYQSDFYDEYFIPPSAMLADAVATWLGSARIFREVLPTGSGAQADYLLEGFTGALYADIRDAAKPAAVLEIKFLLTDASSGAVVWNHDYAQRVTMANASADAFASAMNQALSQLLTELGGELANLRLPAPPG